MTVVDDQVARAAYAVPRGHYVDHPRFGSVPQATAQAAIERDLRRADVRPGQRVLEIGTGTGFTGALLAELVGPSGQVVSVDIDPALTSRAAELHAERHVGNITLVTGDGNQGAPGHGPFDVVIAWATPTVIPEAWLAQARPGAVICTPVYFAETAKCSAHVRATVTRSGLSDLALGEASYVDMGGEVNTSFGIPMFYLDATQEGGGDKPAWISVGWRGRHPGDEPRRALEMLTAPGHRKLCSLADGEREHRTAWRDFRAYCAARDSSTNLTSHGTIDGSVRRPVGRRTRGPQVHESSADAACSRS